MHFWVVAAFRWVCTGTLHNDKVESNLIKIHLREDKILECVTYINSQTLERASVAGLIAESVLSRQKYLNNYWIDCHKMLYRDL